MVDLFRNGTAYRVKKHLALASLAFCIFVAVLGLMPFRSLYEHGRARQWLYAWQSHSQKFGSMKVESNRVEINGDRSGAQASAPLLGQRREQQRSGCLQCCRYFWVTLFLTSVLFCASWRWEQMSMGGAHSVKIFTAWKQTGSAAAKVMKLVSFNMLQQAHST